jgi:hypothetical protein
MEADAKRDDSRRTKENGDKERDILLSEGYSAI